MNKCMISVIVPVYNVENYIEKCIRSIISQDYSDIEIVLVDDGAKDKSGEICDHYAKIDSRIRVIHKENGGLSDARNTALDIIHGDYVIFVDSDDYIKPNYISYLYKLIKDYDADISICNFVYINEEGGIINHIENSGKITEYNRKDAIAELLAGNEVNTSASMKMFKTALFEHVRYPKGKYYEDISTTYKLILKADKIVYGDMSLYVYLCRNGSITKQLFNIKHLDAIENIENMCNDISRLYPDMAQRGGSRIFSQYLNAYSILLTTGNSKELESTLFAQMSKMNKPLFHGRKAKLYWIIMRLGKDFFDLVIKLENAIQIKRKKIKRE